MKLPLEIREIIYFYLVVPDDGKIRSQRRYFEIELEIDYECGGSAPPSIGGLIDFNF